ncbi:HAD hydrolase-like protein [Exiguobacterium flavidum]|uniref:HAD hydrolase-like protein n=1 Tax=Exiguobacterium flavidum TaxID=2184695 RepID=UPI000DF83D9A
MKKPDPQLFGRVLERHDGSAAESIYVGDPPHDDVDGAKRLGMKKEATLERRRG